MSQADLGSIATALAESSRAPRPVPGERHAARPELSFSAQMASFYPYPQSPVDPQPRTAAGDPSQRTGAVPGVAAPLRRQSRRGES